MDFESPDVEKEFPGLYASESSRRSDSDYGDSGQHECSGGSGKKDLLRSKRKDKKDKGRDKGYAALGEDSSPDDMEPQDARNPLKPKKQKSFKFLHKREKEEKEERREEKKKEKEERKIDKRKEKEERKREKEEKKKVKKEKKKKIDEADEEELPVFGVPLGVAVQRCPAHDGVQLPAIVRECIDQIEERGLHCEGIYRLSGVKSKVQQLRRQYNAGESMRLSDHEPHVVASLLKQYLRELPEPVLTVDMMPHFEDVAMIPNPGERAEAMRQLIDRLPTANRLLLQYMFTHMGHVIARERDTKMTYQNVSIVLSPTMQISHRVLSVLFLNHAYLFGGVTIKKYVPPIGSSSSSGERTLDQLRTVAEIEAEMLKQESLLGHLHAQVTAGNVSRRKEESLWEAQRIVTLLKRKLRSAQRREEEERQWRQSGGERRKAEMAEKESTSEECECDALSSKGGACVSDDSSGGGGSSGHKQRLGATTTTTTTATTTTATTTNNVTFVSTEDASSGTESGRLEEEEEKEERKQEEEKEEEEEEEEKTGVEEEKEEKPTEDSTIEEVVPHVTVIPVVPQVTSVPEVIPVVPQVTSVPEVNLGIPQVTSVSGVTSGTPGVLHITSEESEGSPVAPRSDPPPPAAPSQRPEVRRLMVDKLPLRGTRSLEDTRGKDSEHLSLLAKEVLLQAEHEELLSMNHDLMKKLQAERAEITRLKEEIQEMQTLYGYRTYSYDSSESDGSESDGESDTEEDMLARLSHVTKANRALQDENHALTRRIQEEREAVVHMRVKLQEAQWKGLLSHETPVSPIC